MPMYSLSRVSKLFLLSTVTSILVPLKTIHYSDLVTGTHNVKPKECRFKRIKILSLWNHQVHCSILLVSKRFPILYLHCAYSIRWTNLLSILSIFPRPVGRCLKAKRLEQFCFFLLDLYIIYIYDRYP